MTVIRAIYELFPPKTREKMKAMLSSTGHGVSPLDNLKARDHALGKKRLDRIAEHMADILRLAGIASLEGKACLEFGAGYVPSEVLVFYLLGGSPVMATDYNPIAKLDRLVLAARTSNKDKLIATLSPFSSADRIESRLAPLLDGDEKRAQGFVKGLVKYLAPYDMSTKPIAPGFDFIHSVSVMEHVPPTLAEPILRNLWDSLNERGQMAHEIDLCDHLDMHGAPLAFFTATTDYDPNTDFDRRGNRIRRGTWLAMLANLPGAQTSILYEKKLSPSQIPPDLQPECLRWPAEDVETSWIGLLSKRS